MIVSDISFVTSFNMGITFVIIRQEGNNGASTGAMTTAAGLKYFTSKPSLKINQNQSK